MKRIILPIVVACSIFANHLSAKEHVFICYGNGTYNGEGLDASNGMKLIIDKDGTDVFYTFWVYGKYQLEVDPQFYTHNIFDQNSKKVERLFSLNRSTLQFQWATYSGNTNIFLEGECEASPEPKI